MDAAAVCGVSDSVDAAAVCGVSDSVDAAAVCGVSNGVDLPLRVLDAINAGRAPASEPIAKET